MLTSSVVVEQAPLVILQRITTVVPAIKPVIVVVGELAVVIVAVPLTTLQLPVPMVAVLPAKVAVVTLHMVWFGPASATVAGSDTLMVIVSVDGGQLAFVIVHTKVDVPPIVNPVTPLVAEPGVVTTAVPDTTVQTPVPTPAEFPDNVVVVVLHNAKSGPALAVVGD